MQYPHKGLDSFVLILVFGAIVLNTDNMKALPRSFSFALAALFTLFFINLNADELTFPVTQQTAKNVSLHDRPGAYDYAPSLILNANDGLYHMYWCGLESAHGIRGDYILHAQAKSPEGPWHSSTSTKPNSYDVVLGPSGKPGTFDAIHVCDPTVLVRGGRYYLFYGGLNSHHNGPESLTEIGLAIGNSPTQFERANGGNPLVKPSKSAANWQARGYYGAGQPTVVYRAPFYYLAYTDSTGAGSNPHNGAGQYLLRSITPEFDGIVEEFRGNDWVRLENSTQATGTYSFLEAFSIDLAFDARIDAFWVGQNGPSMEATDLVVFNQNFQAVGRGRIPQIWADGPALLVGEGRSLLSRDRCGRLPITMAVGAPPRSTVRNEDPWSWDITLSQGVLDISALCPNEPPSEPEPPQPPKPEPEPKSPVDPSTFGPLVGYIDTPAPTLANPVVRGWACEAHAPDPVALHLYAGHTLIGGYETTLPHEADIRTLCHSGAQATHRFEIRLSEETMVQHGGKPLTIYAISRITKRIFPLVNSGAYTVPTTPRSEPTPTPSEPLQADFTTTPNIYNEGGQW